MKSFIIRRLSLKKFPDCSMSAFAASIVLAQLPDSLEDTSDSRSLDTSQQKKTLFSIPTPIANEV